MNRLVISIGNTNIQIGCKYNNKVYFTRFYNKDVQTFDIFYDKIIDFLKDVGTKLNLINKVIVSSVINNEDDYISCNLSKVLSCPIYFMNSNSKYSVDYSKYKSDSIGIDRIIICEQAYSICKNDFILFDFGTATTVNVVIDGVFEGGMIIPGLEMSVKALADNTSLLPMVNLKSNPTLLGFNTSQSINSGIVYCNVSLIEGTILKLNKLYEKEFEVFITGGNASILFPSLSINYKYYPTLLIDGLLQYEI